MRILTAGQATVLAGDAYSVHSRVWVENGSGTLKQLTSLEGVNWFERLAFQSDIDQFAERVTLSLRRDHGTSTLAPLREDSVLNRLDDVTTYSPLLDADRIVVWEQATLAVNATPISNDWEEVFRGVISEVDAASPTIRCECYGLGRRLIRRYIEALDDRAGQESLMGLDTGQPLQSAIQLLLDAAGESGSGVTLYTPTSPDYEVAQWTQAMESVADAIQRFASLRGWVIRYKWDEGTSSWRLTLYDPGRAKTVPDYTMSPHRYYAIERLSVGDEGVRNVVRVFYTDPNTPDVRQLVTSQDFDSIGRYGRQFLAIGEATGSPVYTAAGATTMAEAVLADLKEPKAEVEAEMPFFWPVELHDLLRFTANSVHSNVTQDWAVVSIRHELSNTTLRTTLGCRGSVAGQFFGWRRTRGEVVLPAMPSITSMSAPMPVYEGSAQVGWRQTGAVGDNTRALVFAVAGDVSLYSITSS